MCLSWSCISCHDSGSLRVRGIIELQCVIQRWSNEILCNQRGCPRVQASVAVKTIKKKTVLTFTVTTEAPVFAAGLPAVTSHTSLVTAANHCPQWSLLACTPCDCWGQGLAARSRERCLWRHCWGTSREQRSSGRARIVAALEVSRSDLFIYLFFHLQQFRSVLELLKISPLNGGYPHNKLSGF